MPKNKTVEAKEQKRLNKKKSYWCKTKELNENSKVKVITTKKIETANPLQLVKRLEHSLVGFLKHTFTIEKQYKEIKNLKDSLDIYEAVIHMDWSENYDLKYHKEVQSMHFGSNRRQVSLHTSVLYLYDESGTKTTQAFCTISQNVRHDAAAIWAHLKPVLDYIYHINSSIGSIHILTDSPSSQYRNKNIFWIMTRIHKDYPGFLNTLTWNYSESGHGKGAADGVGAVIKRTADSLVNLGQDIGNFDDFQRILKEHLKNIKIVVVEETKISEKSNSLPKTLPAFKGTLDVHQVLWDLFCGPDLTIRKFSCFKCKAGCACEHGAHLGFFTVPDISEPVTVTVLAAAKNMNDNICFRESLGTYKSSTIMRLNNENEIKDTFREPSTSRNIPTAFDFEQVVPVSVSHVSKMTLYDKENILPTPSTSKTDHIPINLNLKVADWILIKKSERVKKHQIARVIGIYGGNVSISILKKVPGGFGWPKSRNRDMISVKCVKAILAEPKIDKNLNFNFSNIDNIYF
ncbi:hypothetical protein ACJJTC_008128 [Scirpophaga incertulas]